MKSILLLAALAASPAMADMERAYVLDPTVTNKLPQPGAYIQRNLALQIYYLDRPCTLPLVEAKSMRAFGGLPGGPNFSGCWYPTLNNNFVAIVSTGITFDGPLWVMSKVKIYGGTVMRVTEDF